MNAKIIALLASILVALVVGTLVVTGVIGGGGTSADDIRQARDMGAKLVGASQQFEKQTQSVVGDSASYTMGPSVVRGNGNGKIDPNESALAFTHLAAVGLIEREEARTVPLGAYHGTLISFGSVTVGTHHGNAVILQPAGKKALTYFAAPDADGATHSVQGCSSKEPADCKEILWLAAAPAAVQP